MKKQKNLTIKVKIPYISEEKKNNYRMLIKKGNIKPKNFNNIEKSENKPLKHFNSVDLLKSLTSFNEKKLLFKSFSNNNLYVTKLPSEEKRKKTGGDIDYENFGLQIIPPYNKKNRVKLKENENKTKDKELQYIGRILGLSKKKFEKKTEKKKIIPLETRKEYYNYIRHKRNLFFNPNATSNYVHEKSSNYLVSSITKTKQYSILYENNKRQKDNKEEALELRDKVPNMSYEHDKMMKKIKDLFSEDFKFNNVLFNEDFYQNNENKINFMQDIFRVPVLKNNLVKIKIDKNSSFTSREWKKISAINHQTWNFLMQVKRKIQREKDEKNKKLEEYLNKKREQEKEYEILEKKNRGETFLIKKDEKKNLEEEKKFKNIIDDIYDKEENKEKIKVEDLYSAEEYFLRRNNYFDDTVSVASQKIKKNFFK